MVERKRKCVEMQDDDGSWWLVCDDGTRVRLAFGSREGPSLTLSIRLEQAAKDDDDVSASR